MGRRVAVRSTLDGASPTTSLRRPRAGRPSSLSGVVPTLLLLTKHSVVREKPRWWRLGSRHRPGNWQAFPVREVESGTTHIEATSYYDHAGTVAPCHPHRECW